MKATMTMLVILLVVAGMGLVGDAFAQPADPAAAASELSGDGSAAEGTKPETKESDEATAPEDKPSAAEEAKEKEAPEGVAEQGKALYSAAKDGDWMIVLALAMMLIGTIGRWAVGKKWEFLKSKSGGYMVAIAMGIGILGTGMYQVGFSLGLLMNAALVTTSSMGLYGAAKDAAKKPASA